MATVPLEAQRALDYARRGEFDRALIAANAAVDAHPNDVGLRLFIGMLHARRSDLDLALPHMQAAVRLAPADLIARFELIRVLIGLGRLDEGAGLLEGNLPGVEPIRLRAQIAARRGDVSAAAGLYRQAIERDPKDFESWGNLGVCLLAAEDPKAAVDALTRSLQLRRDQQPFRDKWAEAQVAAGTAADVLPQLRDWAAVHSDDVLIRVTIARVEDLLGRPDAALLALDEALALDPAHVPALVALAELHERQNRLEDSAASVRRIEACAGQLPALGLLKARLAYRRGDFREALELTRQSPASADAGSRAHLMGQIFDRMNEPAQAFEAFSEMNREIAVVAPAALTRGQQFRSRIARRTKQLSRPWVLGWRRGQQPRIAREPMFLVGFPRSGTTLLDTLLMGHPSVCVAEEKPMIDTIARQVGDYERLASLDDGEMDTLRALYFAQAAVHAPQSRGKLLVDKQPFGMLETPLIHRLFPTAKIMFAQRHPCDVVLSCFITRFSPNDGLVNFLTIEDAARLYDQMMTFWRKCRATLPLIVHDVRYERLVEEPELEMRPLSAFLGLKWNEQLLDNRSTAADRGFINTPSYSQVIEPVNGRAAGRWERYRRELEPVLPILEPWVKQMGYDL